MTSASGTSLTCDSSILIAVLAPWHERHQVAREAVAGRIDLLPAHVYLETFSALTRITGERRSRPTVARDVLAALGWELVAPAADDYPKLITRLADAGLPGGAVYDGLIGATAAAHGLTLLTADRRARRTYDAVGAEVEYVG